MKIKKLWVLLAIGTLTTVIVWCSAPKQDDEISKISNLAEILTQTSLLPQQYKSHEITLEEFNAKTLELQERYEALTQNDIENMSDEVKTIQENVTQQFELNKKTIDTEKESCDIPAWAVALWISKPEWLKVEEDWCRLTSLDVEGFDSITLVYEGEYEAALQQAKIIAEKAKVPVSAEFKMAQESLSGLTTEEIGQITSGSMLKWVVYTNVGLLATDMKYLITISVDENGKLVIEATNYEQMKK